jgi:hypothetical protein
MDIAFQLGINPKVLLIRSRYWFLLVFTTFQFQVFF